MKQVLRRFLVIGIAGLTACEDAAGPSGGITVTGVVVDENLRPQGSVGVLITGHRQVHTDASGRFSVSGVNPPYDLATWVHFESAAVIYLGITRADPLVVQPAGRFSELPNRATVTGWVAAGAGYTQPPNRTTVVTFESPELTWRAAVDPSGTFTAYPRWKGRASITGTVHALQWQSDPATGARLRYGYGSRTGVPLTPNATVSEVEVPLMSVETGSISGAVRVPDGYAVTIGGLLAGFESSTDWNHALDVARGVAGATEFNYVVPALAGAPFAAWARASSADQASVTVVKSGIAGNAAGVSLDMRAAPALLEPAANATGVHNATRFSWTGFGDVIYLLSIRFNSPDPIIPPPANFYVFTTDTTAVLPDLSEFSLFLYRGQPYFWEVFAWGPFESIDEIVAERWFIPRGDMRSARSARRGFTTVPWSR